jgi:Flp pilus assembly protein TadG
MRRSRRGQVMVEFALVFPVLLLFILGIIDVSYLVFNWSEVQFAARRGAEQGSKAPPLTVKSATTGTNAGGAAHHYDDIGPFNQGYATSSDGCYAQMLVEIQRIGSFSTATTIRPNEVNIAFLTRNGTPAAGANPDNAFIVAPANTAAARAKENILEVMIVHRLAPLTPLGDTIFGATLTFSAVSRRSIIVDPTYIKC